MVTSNISLPNSFHQLCTQSTSLFPDSQTDGSEARLHQNGANLLIIGNSHRCGTQEKFRILCYKTQLSHSSVYLGVWGKLVQCFLSALQHSRMVGWQLVSFTPAPLTTMTQDAPLWFSGQSWRKQGEHLSSYLGFPKESSKGKSSLAVINAIT